MLNSTSQNAIFKYVVDGVLPDQNLETFPPTSGNRALDYLVAVEEAKRTTDIGALIALINKYNLPREVLPTQALRDPKVWETLLYAGDGMPITALIRNLATMTRIGLIAQGSDAARYTRDRLTNAEVITNGRVHPIDMLKAKLTYESGHGQRSDNSWNPVGIIVSALESGFYLSFGNVTPTNKRVMLALDVSGSMASVPYDYKTGSQGLAGCVPGRAPCLITERWTQSLAVVRVR